MIHKIIFVIDNLEFGGGERGFLQIIKGLNKEKYIIHVASNPSGKFGKKIREMGIPLVQVNMRNRYNPFTILKLRHIIKKGNFHIVHSQGARADFFTRVAMKATPRSHLVSTIQMPLEGFNVGFLRKKIYCMFDQISERYVDHFIVVSDSLKRSLIEDHRIPWNKVSRIYNGIELDMYKPDVSDQASSEIRREFGIKNEDFIIGAIGRMVWQKGFEYLIRSLPKIINLYSELKVLLVGNGPLRNNLEELAERLKLKEHLIFTGFRNDIKEILSSINLLVVPSILEGFPMITLEAMAMAKPIIATNIDGITEQIINKENGILVPPKDPDALSKAIIRIIDDKESRKIVGSAGRKKVEHEFSVNKMVRETEKVYSYLLKGNYCIPQNLLEP